MSTLAQLGSEIKSLFEAAAEIESKYPDGLIANTEEKAKVDEYLDRVGELEQKYHDLEDADRRRERIEKGRRLYGTTDARDAMQHPTGPAAGDIDEQRKSIGQRFIDNSEYLDLKNSGQFGNNRNIVQFAVQMAKTRLVDHVIQRKSLVYSNDASGGGMIVNDRQPGVLELFQRERTLLDLIPRATTDSDMIEYVKILAFTNNAAVVAEASATTGTSGTKPESAITTTTVTNAVPTIAHWIPVTNKMLADAPAIRGIIDQHLLVGLELALETEVLSGDGTGEHMTGILSAGISVQAKSTDSALDAVFKALQKVRITGLVRPTAVVMHPTDFGNIRLARENAATGTLGNYLMGPPSMGGEVTLWGLPVVSSLALSAGTALVGAFNLGGMLFEREGAQIRVGLINDQFVRNQQTILAEARATWATFRPTAFCQVTGL